MPAQGLADAQGFTSSSAAHGLADAQGFTFSSAAQGLADAQGFTFSSAAQGLPAITVDVLLNVDAVATLPRNAAPPIVRIEAAVIVAIYLSFIAFDLCVIVFDDNNYQTFKY